MAAHGTRATGITQGRDAPVPGKRPAGMLARHPDDPRHPATGHAMLSIGHHLALGSPWWSWDSPAIRKALWASVLARLRRLGNDRLAANRLAGRSPADWRDLDVLRKEARTLRRVF